MSSQAILGQVNLVDYATLAGTFATEILPQIAVLFDPDEITVKVLPAAENQGGLTAGLQTELGSCLVVFYNSAEPAIQKALLSGHLPSKALAQWQDNMEVLLTFYRQHRRNVLLVDKAAIRRNPQMFITRLTSFLKTDVSQNATIQFPESQDNHVEAVLARQVAVQSLSAQRLSGELNASSLRLEDTLPCDVDAAFTAHTDGKRAPQTEAENMLLTIQLAQVQEEVGGCIHRLGAGKQQISDLNLQNSNLKLQISDLKLQITQLREKLQQREDDLQRFLESTSWRITGPLRRAKNRLTQTKDQEN